MESSFEALSIELIEMLVTCLELHDIGSLRLTSRTLEAKASKGYFTTFFTRKDVKLTTKDLKDMVQVTSQSYLGRRLQHCTITGIARGRHEEKADVNEEEKFSRLLAEAFRNVNRHSQKRGIASLCLRITATQPDNAYAGSPSERLFTSEFHGWRAVWDAAVSTFNIVLAALEDAQLPVNEHLDIFGSVKGCSLSCDVFQTFVEKFAASMHNFQDLKKLTLRLSAPPRDVIEWRFYSEMGEDEDREYVMQQQSAEAEHSRLRNHPSSVFPSILQLLGSSMPDLESLDLHWYHVGKHFPVFPDSSSTECGTTNQLYTTRTKPLQECTLRGIYTSENELLRFLKAVQPSSLTLIHVTLAPGSAWDVIFDYLTDPASPISEYHLDDVSVRFDLVHYENIPGTSKFRYSVGPIGPSTLTRSANQAKQTIRYRFAGGRALGSPEKNRWNCFNSSEYGWPHLGRYDFIGLNTPPKITSGLGSDDESEA